MTILRLSWRNIMAKPLSTLLSVLLFSLGIGLITFLALFNHQLKQGLDRNLAHIDLVIGAKGSPLQLILNSMYHIDAPTGNISLADAAPFLNPQHPVIAQAIPLSLGDSYGAYRIVGTLPSLLTMYGARSLAGEIYREDFDVLAGSVVADRLHLHIGDTFYSTHGLLDNPEMTHDHGTPFTVRGILESTGTVLDQLILCTPGSIWKVHAHDTTSDSIAHDHADGEHIHYPASVHQVDAALLKRVSDSIGSTLTGNTEKEITSILITFRNKTSLQALNFLRNINANTNLMAASPALELNRLYAMLGNGTDALRYLAFLIAFVSAISIFISLYTSLRERKYEMAIMRVSGAGPWFLFRMILFEGLFISAIGVILGLLAGHAGMQLAGEVFEKTYRYAFSGWLWIQVEWFVVAGALVLGVLAAILPAIRGAGINLHQVLAEG